MTDKFQRDYGGLSPDIKSAVDVCIQDLGRDPLPATRRAHSITPRGQKPTIFSLDVTGNKSHKLSFHIEGRVAVLRRVGTHKQIDRAA